MKGTEHFTRTIAEYLNQRAMTDPLFAPNLMKPNKNIEECITYILNEVQKSGCNGFDDDEIFSMAVHYYDEDDIEVGKAISCQVAVNHIVELTEEEKAEARQEAIKQCKYLRPITKTQSKWAFRECIDHFAYRLPKGRTTCMDCGHSWVMNKQRETCTCPHCRAKL